jgi:hypothetical protein
VKTDHQQAPAALNVACKVFDALFRPDTAASGGMAPTTLLTANFSGDPQPTAARICVEYVRPYNFR